MIDFPKMIRVAVIGNPNCGKTTLFNALTGAKLKVANWPGVTVEKIEGEIYYKGQVIKLIDTPGIYSLSCYTLEETVTRRCLEDGKIDAIINVVDASALERNLYLTLQLLEFNKPVILALNMIDIVEERGMKINLDLLAERLGQIPAVFVSARKRTGLNALMEAIIDLLNPETGKIVVKYSPQIENRISSIEKELLRKNEITDRLRWTSIKLLEWDKETEKMYPLDLGKIIDRNYEKEIINEKYNYIEEIIKECMEGKEEKVALTDKADYYLTHPILGIPIFLILMAFVFFLTFSVGNFFKGYMEALIESVSFLARTGMERIHAASWIQSMVADGVIAGVGGILTFLPNIFILFFALAFLEDSGYMSRVAYVMNEIMGKAGLSGKAFLPMLLGFGCTVPAVMAARSLPSEKDRKRTILLTPFMSCSAKLPIYILFSGMFFPYHTLAVSYSLYIFGLIAAVILAYWMHKRWPAEEADVLLIELPEYKIPNARTVLIYVWEKVKDYLNKAGTIIFLASIVLWFLLRSGPGGFVHDVSQSFAAIIGRMMVPFLRPAGLGDWRIAVALISGLSAKEVVVSSFSILFGIQNINSFSGMSMLWSSLNEIGFGGLNAYALMVFCLLYSPCIAALGVIWKETGSFRWLAGIMLFQLAVAWTASVCVFQIGKLIF